MNTLTYVLLGLCSLSLIFTIILLVKISKKEEDPRIAVLSEKIDQIGKQNQFLYTMTDKSLREIRETNEEQLNKMRQTVDEKLQQTLESRLSGTFKAVSTQLENVYRQLGEMQNLAKGVDNLEKVLTNVKTRGIWGELQAEKILQDILLPDQYLTNVRIKSSSLDNVEFAVKLPGTESDRPVLLPIDSKFPMEDYERLCDAGVKGSAELIKNSRRALEVRIRNEARSIQSKYIDVPKTTDFAILFLPVEGLYAEVLSIPGLQDQIHRENHVLISGPSTLASLLNSLQMGFRTLAIEKKSAEVWHVLGQVKSQFFKFEEVLKKVQEKLNSASSEVEKAFERNRILGNKLKKVESPEEDNPLLQDFTEDI